jgi:hypothetical protein
MRLCALQHAKTAYQTERQISDCADGTPEGIAEPLWRQGGGNGTLKMNRSGFALLHSLHLKIVIDAVPFISPFGLV